MKARVTVCLIAAVCSVGCFVRHARYRAVPGSVVEVRTTWDPKGRIVGTEIPNDACEPTQRPCLAFLEFDEQGESWDDRQLPAALALIGRAKRNPMSKPPIVVTFVHGWKNNAQPGNGNVVGFEGVLEFLHERMFPGFPIVGVYLSWRGDTIPKAWPIRRQLSYFNREEAAIRIPGPSVTRALTEVMIEARRDRPETFLIMAGHSFGALVLERALAQAMTDHLLRLRAGGSAARRETAASASSGNGALADLVVFVNSAASASEGKQMLDLLKGLELVTPERRDRVNNELPLFLSISSLGDAATRFAMPIGHGPSFLGKKIRGSWRSYPAPTPTVPPSSPSPADIRPPGAQSAYYMSTTAHMEALQSHIIVEGREGDACPSSAFTRPFQLPNGRVYQICEKPRRWNDTPYWAMQMPASVVPDHGGIFNENFLGLLTQFFLSPEEMVQPTFRGTLMERR